MANQEREAANNKLLKRLLLVVLAAVAFTVALVPLYNVLCQATGFNGKTQGTPAEIKKSTKIDGSRWVEVEFIGNAMPGLAWDFYPKQLSVRVHPGQVQLATFLAKNMTNTTVAGQAIPSVSPSIAALYFKKIECFCFKRQELKPGESKEMPLTFYINPEIPENVRTITLSYSFFNAVK